VRSVIKSVLKFVMPDGVGIRLRRLRNGALNAIRGVPSRARLAFRRNEQFMINLSRRARRVVFVSEVPSQRESKLSYGLKRAGWDVIQFYRGKSVLTDLSSVAEAREFRSSWEAVELAHRAECRLFHNFSYTGDDTSVRLTENKPGRVIFDIYDYFFSIVDGLPEQAKAMQADIARQTYCIESADALCCRDLQMQYRRKEINLARGKPLILFPEYCWNNQRLPQTPTSSEVHIVQIGTMGLETIGQDDIGCYRIFERFVEAGCHLDIYLHPYFPQQGTPEFGKVFAQYLALQARTNLVHFHPPVSPLHMVGEISGYDFGAAVANGLSFDIPWSHQNAARFPLCGSSRMFDYIDAGIGLILHRQLRFLYKTFQKYGVVRDATDLIRAPDLKAALGQKPNAEVISRARAELSIDRNISRLTAFYETLA
jgi:hypothetical protein